MDRATPSVPGEAVEYARLATQWADRLRLAPGEAAFRRHRAEPSAAEPSAVVERVYSKVDTTGGRDSRSGGGERISAEEEKCQHLSALQ